MQYYRNCYPRRTSDTRDPPPQIKGDNHALALRILTELDDNIASKLAAGSIKVINKLPPFYISSPLGAVQKEANAVQILRGDVPLNIHNRVDVISRALLYL